MNTVLRFRSQYVNQSYAQSNDKVKETHGIETETVTDFFGITFRDCITVYKKSVILLLTQKKPTVEYEIIARIRNYIQFT